jgi:hypothetical protein
MTPIQFNALLTVMFVHGAFLAATGIWEVYDTFIEAHNRQHRLYLHHSTPANKPRPCNIMLDALIENWLVLILALTPIICATILLVNQP